MINVSKLPLFAVVLFVFAPISVGFTAENVQTKGSPPSHQPAGMKASTPQMLPSTLKINPRDVSIMGFDEQCAKLKADWKQVGEKVTLVNNKMPLLDQTLAALKNKGQECMNKSYTSADMTAAGCTNNVTVAVCSIMLYQNCLRAEFIKAQNMVSEIWVAGKEVDKSRMLTEAGWERCNQGVNNTMTPPQ